MKLDEAQQLSKNDMAFLKDGERGTHFQGWAWHKEDDLPFRATLSVLPTIFRSGTNSELPRLRLNAQSKYHSFSIRINVERKANRLKKFEQWVPCIPISPLEALAKAGE